MIKMGRPLGSKNKPKLTDSPEGRICRRCGEWKLREHFGQEQRVNCGLKSTCNQCRCGEYPETKRRWIRERKLQRMGGKFSLLPPPAFAGQKGRQCLGCKVWKAANCFGSDKRGLFGLRSLCNICRRVRARSSDRDILFDLRFESRQERYRADPQRYIGNWQKKNKAKVRQYKAKWKTTHLAAVVRHSQIRRTRIAGKQEHYTLDQWMKLCSDCGNICLSCQQPKPLTVDHVVPISRGGNDTIENIQPLCIICNVKKGTKILDFRRSKDAA